MPTNDVAVSATITGIANPGPGWRFVVVRLLAVNPGEEVGDFSYGPVSVHDLVVTITCEVAAPAPPRATGLPPVDPSRDEVLFGVDIDVASDLPRSFVLASGLRNLANAIVRRLSTPNGALAAFGDDPDYGLDLRGKLNASMPLPRIQALGPDVEVEVLKEERVNAANVALAFDLASGVLTVDISMATALGPFRLILAVSADRTIEIING